MMRWMILMLAVGWIGCGGGEPAPGPVVMDATEQENWEIALVEMRIEKNEAFMDSSQTALPLADLAAFEGLNYYFPVPELRFRARLEREDRPDTVVLTKRKGQQVPYLRKGKVCFRHEGRTYCLAVFGPATADQEDFLWLPFTDETAAEETYPGGRYLDLEVASDGEVELDFNYAYNPLCDYDPERYNCTLPPPENKLPFAVRAGEKRYHPSGSEHESAGLSE